MRNYIAGRLRCAVLLIILLNTAETVFAQDSAAERKKLIEYAKTFIGTPYVYGGNTKMGIDCSGFICTVARDSVKISLPRTTTQLYEKAEPINRKDLQPGDLIFFKTTGSNQVSHVGFFLGRNQFIHAASDGPNTGVIVSSLDEAYWKGKYYSSGRFFPYSAVIAKADGEKEKPAVPAAAAPAAKKTLTKIPSQKFEWEIAGTGNWSFITPQGVRLAFHGAALSAGIVYNKWAFNIGVRYDHAMKLWMIPFTLHIPVLDTFRFFVGPAITFGTGATLPMLIGAEVHGYVRSSYPKIALFQEISYFFPDITKPSGYASPHFTANFCFSTGIRFVFPVTGWR